MVVSVVALLGALATARQLFEAEGYYYKILGLKSRVTQSYNSYGGLSKKQTILQILQQEQRPLTPKEISWISKSDSRIEPLNHNTVKVYCRQLLGNDKIQNPIYGYYKLTQSTYGMGNGLVGPRVHDLRLVWCVGEVGVVPSVSRVVGGVSVGVVFGRKRGKVSATVGCDGGMDFDTVCFVVDYVRRVVWERAGINLDSVPCSVCCEFNEDFQGVRLDGVKCVTVKSFLGGLERIYNKGSGVRSEIKVDKTDLPSMYAMLKGGVSYSNLLQTQFQMMKKMDRLAVLFERILKKK